MIETIDYGKTNLQELHQALLDLLTQFDKFCDDNKQLYFAYGGTLLGAIRHKGFIPWDDDVDIGMRREDYNRFLQVIQKNPSLGDTGKYQFINAEIDRYFNKGFTRLTNCETTEISIKDAPFTYNRGCFIDIIPLDYVPESAIAKKIYFFRCNAYINLLRMCSRYTNGLNLKNWSVSKRIVYYFLLPLFVTRVFTPQKLHKWFQNYLTKQKVSTQLGNSTIVPGNSRWIFDVDWFQKRVDMPFEEISISCPEKYDAILTKQYGDYMKPVVESSSHGDTIIDLNIPYKKYIEDHKYELMSLWENRSL